MLTKDVTLCLLITYHWAGRTLVEGGGGGGGGGRGRGRGEGGFWSLPEAAGIAAGIAVEVNGSPTDARLNIPVVKRSSNQAEFANELRGIPMERATSSRVPDDAGGQEGFLGLPHEYSNRNEEKYNGEDLAIHSRESKERGKLVEIKSSIPKEVRLIGGINSSEGTLRLKRNFYYNGVSTSATRLSNKRVKREADDVANVEVDKKKIILKNEDVNNRRGVVSSVFALGLRTRIQRDTGELMIRNSVDSTTETIDSEFEKQRKHQQEDYDASRMSQNRLSSALSSLKLTEQAPYKLTSSLDNHKQVILSKRLHQQSRNTKPSTIIQHLRRNTKRQAFDDNSFSRSKAFLGIKNQENLPSSTGDSQLRFIPANNHHRADNRVYFHRIFKPLSPSNSFQGNDASPFIEDNETNPQGIPRFNVEQLEKLKNSIKGVFDKYEARQQGQIDLLPNVRMIQSKQIFVAPPRVIYDTKILPAPDSFNRYQDTSRNINSDIDNQSKIMNVGFAMKGVFDQSHDKSQLDQREVIPVREDSAPSLTSTENFVTPLPPYQVGSVEGGGGGGGGGRGGEGRGGGGSSIGSNHQVLVNQPSEDSKLQEIYRVREEEMRNSGLENESQRDENDEDRNEDSRLDHESPIDVGAMDHFRDGSGVAAGGGSSYDNFEITSANQHHESGSTNVDHSHTVEGTIDEYVNGLHTIRTSTPTSTTRSNGNSYDRGNYKWRNDDDHERYAANYSFGYRVSDYETENEFGHQETRKEGITMGKYHVKLPDGRIQKVNYHVDDGGYHASVSYHRDNVE